MSTGQKVTELNSINVPDEDDLLYLVSAPATLPVGKKLTLTNLDMVLAGRGGHVHARDYGTVGNGVANDAPALQAALDAAAAAGGGTVWLAPGTYNLATLEGSGFGAIEVPANVTLRGTWKSILTGGNTGFVNLNSGSAIIGVKLVGDGNPAYGSQTGIHCVSGTESARVIGCWIEAMGYDGIFPGGEDVIDLLIDGNVIIDCQDDGINPAAATTGPARTRIVNNYIAGCTNAGIHVSLNSADTQIIGNTIRDCGNGIDTFSASGVTIVGNLIEDILTPGGSTSGAGIAVASGALPDVIIANNQIRNTAAQGIYLRQGSAPVVLAGNMISGTAGIGIEITCTATGADCLSVTGNVVTMTAAVDGIRIVDPTLVTLAGNVVTGLTPGHAINITRGDDCVVSGNAIIGGERGITIEPTAAAARLVVAGNVISGTGTNALILYGPGSGVMNLAAVVSGNVIAAAGRLVLRGIGTALVIGNSASFIQQLYDAAANRYAANQVTYTGIDAASTIDGTLSGTGSPVGVVGPPWIGVEYLDTAGPTWWKSTGVTNTSWVALN